MKDTDQILRDGFDRRGAAWARWGQVESDVLAHMINPTFMGGPRWPAMRQSFRVARAGSSVLVASDGLSDPYDEGEGPGDVNGIGVECFAVTSDPIDTLPGSWFFDMVWQISQFAAGRPDIPDLLDELSFLTTELYNVGIPEESRDRFINQEERVGVFLGLSDLPIPSSIEGPLSTIRLVNTKLLTLDELAFVIDGGDHARHALAKRFVAPRLESSLARESAV